MQLSPELYKGYTIRFIKNIMGNKQVVIGKWLDRGRQYMQSGPTKEYVLQRIKKIIDKKTVGNVVKKYK